MPTPWPQPRPSKTKTGAPLAGAASAAGAHASATRQAITGNRRTRLPILPALAADGEDGAHAARAVVGERAVEQVAAGRQLRLERHARAGLDRRRAGRPRRAEPLEAQVVRVLAEVDDLDGRVAGPDDEARERERELLRRDLHARGGRRGRREGRDHRTTFSRLKLRAPGKNAFAYAPNHCLT